MYMYARVQWKLSVGHKSVLGLSLLCSLNLGDIVMINYISSFQGWGVWFY